MVTFVAIDDNLWNIGMKNIEVEIHRTKDDRKQSAKRKMNATIWYYQNYITRKSLKLSSTDIKVLWFRYFKIA